MPVTKTLYHCDTDNFDFTDGATAEAVNLVTGKPVESLVEGEDFGEGICPNCGNPGEQVGEHVWNDSESGE
jgi:hypothetical protein